MPQFVTLHPGDIILTGTPPGVGCFRKPPLWLKVRARFPFFLPFPNRHPRVDPLSSSPRSLHPAQDGDVVECEIDQIGCITNTVRNEAM
jgi:2-keto-4-pentenoate hydratase/2-oxohepta-3-ene-1,7-dioic acid hydratase in catechol pathway